MENSIEEDIKIVENLLQTAHVDNEEYYKQIEIGDITFNAIKNIVSDYNKVVSELKKYKNMYEAEHEIHTIRNEQLERKENSIKGDGFNMSRIDNIERDVHLLESYAGMTHKMNDNQGRPKLDQAIERILLDYKRLRKENEELTISNKEIDKECSRLEAKEKSRNIEPVLINNKMYFIDKNLYEDLLNDIKSNYIPTQKIKDKIGDLADTANKINNEIVEELKSNDICQEYLEDKRKELRLINRDIKTLQSLLDEREDPKDGEG